MSKPSEPFGHVPWHEHRLVFIAGMHRSGTTLLADILNSAPGFSGLRNTGVSMNEGQHLQSVYVGGRNRVDRWAFAPEAHLTELDAITGADEALWNAWSPFWDLSNTHLVEKSPPNLTKLRFLQELFPDALFVVVTRHPIVQALAVRKWAGRRNGRYGFGFPHLVDHWVHAHEIFAQDAPHVRKLLVIRYEHLMHEPDRVLARTAEFVGAPVPRSDAVDTHRSSEYERTWRKTPAGLLTRTTGHLRQAGRQPWKARGHVAREIGDAVLLPRYRREIAERYADVVRRHGYDLDHLDESLEGAV